MESQALILNFLNRIRRLRFYANILHGTYILLTYIIASYLLVCLLLLNYKTTPESVLLVTIIIGGGLIYILCNYFIRPFLTPFSLDDAALIAESHYPETNNSLINSSQLVNHSKKNQFQNKATLEFIEELQNRTSKVIKNIDISSVIYQKRLPIARNSLIGLLGLLIIIVLLTPSFLTEGYKGWSNKRISNQIAQKKITNKNSTNAQSLSMNYSIDKIDLTLNFPSYTAKKTETIKSSDGKIHALPGTEVTIFAKTNAAKERGSLIFNEKDTFAMSRENSNTFKTSHLVKENGFYQFQLKDSKNKNHLLIKKYPVSLEKDQAPNIVIFLTNPKPVYFRTDKIKLFYEGKDDYGINAIDLVYFVNGEIKRIPVKQFKKHEKEAKNNYTWSLAQMAIKPGEKVSYYLEVKDNDNVYGPNKGQSETYNFSMFDSKKEMDNLIVLQEELTDKMISLLATGLVKETSLKNNPNDLIAWKQLFSNSVDELISIVTLAQKIADRGKEVEQFPQHYLNFLKNITTGLSKIRKSQIDALSEIRDKINKPTQANFKTSTSYSSIINEMTSHLEKDILLMVKISTKQKLKKISKLEQELNGLTQTLRDDFENIKNSKSSKTSDELKNKINKIQQTMQKIMSQLANQTKSISDEFLNPNTLKQLRTDKLSKSLKKMQNMVDKGLFKAALEELKEIEDALQHLSNQIKRADVETESFMDTESLNKLNQGSKKIDQLKMKQNNILKETAQLNNTLRQQQTNKVDNQLNKLFSDLLNDVNLIITVLKKNERYLETNVAMKQLQNLINKEKLINQKIKALNEATVNSVHSEKLDHNFDKLKEVRKNHSQLIEDKDSLRVNEFQRFKEALPQLLKKYKSLNKFAKLEDLEEFSTLFQKLYPEALRWQYRIRSAPNHREELSSRLKKDLMQTTRINNEISKKIGSLMRSIKNNYNSSITMDQKRKLKNLGKQEKQIQQEAEELSQQFDQLSKKNPTLTPELSRQMKQAGRNMKTAEKNLRSQNIPESIKSENLALKSLDKTQGLLNQIKESNGKVGKPQKQSSGKRGSGSSPDSRRGGASTRMQKKSIVLPQEDQYKAPKEFREEILNAMKKGTPKVYEHMVIEYYKNLVK